MIACVFVTGASGFLGSYLVKVLQNYEVYGSSNKHEVAEKNRITRLDITDKIATRDMLLKIRPDVVIHTAALTDVDYCEGHKEEAYKINVEGTKNIVDACNYTETRIIYISTDFVFDGKKGMYREDEKTSPVSYYGITKLGGEEETKKAKNWTIIRTSVPYGWCNTKLNFASWIIKELKEKRKVNIVDDQFTSPTYIENLAEAIKAIMTAEKKGIYHVAGSERISRYDFALKVASNFNLNSKYIHKITSAELKQKARRPYDSSLDVSKFQKEFKLKLFNVQEGLERMRSSGVSK